MLLPHVTTSDSPAASDSSAVTPYNSSAILSDWPTFLREDGVHPSAGGDRARAGGGEGGPSPPSPAPPGPRLPPGGGTRRPCPAQSGGSREGAAGRKPSPRYPP